MEFWPTYGLFLAKTLTFLIAVIIIMVTAVASASKDKKAEKGNIKVTHLNKEMKNLTDEVKSVVIDEEFLKLQEKADKKKAKAELKEKKKAAKDSSPEDSRKRIYVLDFNGDPQASQVTGLRQTITAILANIRPEIDEIVLKLESPGGLVHAYGLAASQLDRIRQREVPLTICIDKVAASGGYMMACLGTKILAAPFAYIGSIGVVLQMPNFNRLLKENNIDYETITGGEYKRTLTTFGENTDKAREKVTEEIQDTHALFKDFVKTNRPVLDIDAVATGETWFGSKALEKKLVDEIKTSDEYIVAACDEAEVYAVSYEQKKKKFEKLSSLFESALDNTLHKWLQRSNSKDQFLS